MWVHRDEQDVDLSRLNSHITESFKGEDIVDEREVNLTSLMVHMAFSNPIELSSARQAIFEHSCEAKTVRWAIHFWQTNWGGVEKDCLDFFAIRFDGGILE